MTSPYLQSAYERMKLPIRVTPVPVFDGWFWLSNCGESGQPYQEYWARNAAEAHRAYRRLVASLSNPVVSSPSTGAAAVLPSTPEGAL